MRYLKSWIEDYVKIPCSNEELFELITELGSEVEGYEYYPAIDEKIVVAEILEIKKHPNADRLQLVKLNSVKGETEVVCGAFNIKVGQKVPYAPAGAMIEGHELKEAEIRGVKSCGMILSERELGLGQDHSGIKILSSSEKIGRSVREVLSQDVIFDLEITPNRGDLLSHKGLAREVAAALNKTIKEPELHLKESQPKASEKISVEIKTENCPLYLAKVIKGVKIGPSPQWLKERLAALGLSSINNVVDATNFILFDVGHPLHAFDAKKLAGSKIVVKDLEEEVETTTLDDKARALISGTMAICDKDKPVAIAGVMGLKNSEVDDQTTEVVLEAAIFNPKSIRRTAKSLELPTEASARFERGVDAGAVEAAVDKAAKLIQEIAGGKILAGTVKAGSEPLERKVKIEYEKIFELISLKLSKSEIDQILTRLGFKIENGEAIVPLWRHDIYVWQDLAEEVVRLAGLNKVKIEALPRLAKKPAQTDYHRREKIKDCLVHWGLTEVINYPFLSEADTIAAKVDPKDLLEVANPIQEENRYLRNSLVPGLLKTVAKNPSFDDIEIYEVGHVFSKKGEAVHLAIATSGKSSRQVEIIVRELTDKLNFPGKEFKIIEIPRDELKRFKIKKASVSIAEINLDEILDELKLGDLSLKVSEKKIDYRPISKFPPVKRDLAFIVDKKVALEDIKEEILKVSNKAVLVEPFDEFVSDKFGKNKKNVAFHIWLESRERTLQDNEAEAEVKKIIEALSTKFAAKLR